MAYTTIDDPTIYFNTVLYTGNASSRTISGIGFQPDWTWSKNRGNDDNHYVFDSVRGATKHIIPDNNTAEGTISGITSWNSDGYVLGNNAGINANGVTAVSWNWKAGGSASSNSNGSITSSVSASTDAGFSIVSWTGNGSTATIGHGLGSAPKVVIIKSRDGSASWFLGHQSLGWTKYMTLENSNAINDDVIWNDTDPTSNVFSVGSYSSTNGSGVKFIGYCFAEKKGYSKIGGSYVGNGNNDGAFIYTGFRPAWIMLKNTSNAQNWYIYDNKRTPTNFANYHFYADLHNAEAGGSTLGIDILSNGWKIKTSNDGWNGSGENYIYMAFAESPFVNSNGIPNNAR
jgi:hypothetical protein